MSTSSARPDLSSYLTLIDTFTDGSIEARDFTHRYMYLIKNEQRILGDPWFPILNELFVDCGAYVDGPDLRERRNDPEDLNEEQLSARASETATKLRSLPTPCPSTKRTAAAPGPLKGPFYFQSPSNYRRMRGNISPMSFGTEQQPLFVTFGEDVPCPAGTQLHVGERPASPPTSSGEEVRITLEVYLRHSGVNTRALLGGIFTHSAGATTVFRLLAEEESIMFERSAAAPSRLGRPLLCGLPSDLAGAAMAGLLGHGDRALPAGDLLVDRAAHDLVDSSELAFRMAGDILVDLLGVKLRGGDVPAAASAAMERWRLARTAPTPTIRPPSPS